MNNFVVEILDEINEYGKISLLSGGDLDFFEEDKLFHFQ